MILNHSMPACYEEMSISRTGIWQFWCFFGAIELLGGFRLAKA
jgi:hypothetical protein